MGIYNRLISQDQIFKDSAKYNPSVVNYFDDKLNADKEEINNKIYISNSSIDTNMPTCQCGQTRSRQRLGEECPNCHTLVTEPIDENLQSIIFIKSPDGCEKFINPIIWLQLQDKFTVNKRNKGGGPQSFSVISYLTDPSYKYNSALNVKSITKIMAVLDEAKLNVRSYDYFVQNFKKYMDVLFDCSIFTKRSNKDGWDLYNLIFNNYDNVFSRYISLPNKTLLMIEKKPFQTYVDSFIPMIVDVARLMMGTDLPDCILSHRQKQSRISKALNGLTDYYREITANYIGSKPGLARKSIFGTRAEYTFRGVISSLTTTHRYDEIHIPWAMAVNVFNNHLKSKLLNKGWHPNRILKFIDNYNLEYNPLMAKLLNEILYEGNKLGFPVLVNRNPTLGKGSIQYLHITRVKTDTSDFTISIPITIVKPFNADFDGDQLNFMLILDKESQQRARNLFTAGNIVGLDGVNKIDGTIAMPKPVASVIANYLLHSDSMHELGKIHMYNLPKWSQVEFDNIEALTKSPDNVPTLEYGVEREGVVAKEMKGLLAHNESVYQSLSFNDKRKLMEDRYSI